MGVEVPNRDVGIDSNEMRIRWGLADLKTGSKEIGRTIAVFGRSVCVSSLIFGFMLAPL